MKASPKEAPSLSRHRVSCHLQAEWRTEPEMPGHQLHPYGTQSLTNLCPCLLARAASIKPGPAPCCPRALPSGHVWMNPRLPPNELPGRRMGSCLCQPPRCNFLTCFVARCQLHKLAATKCRNANWKSTGTSELQAALGLQQAGQGPANPRSVDLLRAVLGLGVVRPPCLQPAPPSSPTPAQGLPC